MVELVISDIDGVLTDGRINIGSDGELFKSFDVKDGYGITNWINSGNKFVIVTARTSQAVTRRAKELGVEEIHQGVSNKKRKVVSIAEQHEVALADIAYIGDDISDIEAMSVVGVGCCPADAANEVRAVSDYVSLSGGGNGAVRDVFRYLNNSAQTAIGIIPARYGSTRLPGKPLVELNGKPMIQHVYERAAKAEELDEILVATDDDRIVEAVEAVDGTAVLTSKEHSTGTDRVAEVAKESSHDLVVNIQGDEPLIDPAVIDAVVQALKKHSPRVATPISPMTERSEFEDKNTVKVITDNEGRALYFSRSAIPSNGGINDMYKHIGLYAFETELLLDYVDMSSTLEAAEDLEQLRLLENGYEIQTVQVEYDAKEVNTKSDIGTVEKKMEESNDI